MHAHFLLKFLKWPPPGALPRPHWELFPRTPLETRAITAFAIVPPTFKSWLRLHGYKIHVQIVSLLYKTQTGVICDVHRISPLNDRADIAPMCQWVMDISESWITWVNKFGCVASVMCYDLWPFTDWPWNVAYYNDSTVSIAAVYRPFAAMWGLVHSFLFERDETKCL